MHHAAEGETTAPWKRALWAESDTTRGGGWVYPAVSTRDVNLGYGHVNVFPSF